jgi:hypothetical protein
MQVRFVAHQGCVNRVRAMMQQPHIVATWGDSGYVQVIIPYSQQTLLTHHPGDF